MTVGPQGDNTELASGLGPETKETVVLRFKKPSTVRRKLAGLALLGAITSGVGAVAGGGSASAVLTHPRCPAGTSWDGENCVANPPPPATTIIYSMTPGYGWSGDSVHVYGVNLLNASVAITSSDRSVTFDGPASITFDSNSDLWFTLPTIHSTTVGSVGLNFHVSTPKGSVDESFSLSPGLHAAGSQTFMNSGGGQDGVASVTADVDRATGTVTEWAHVENYQFIPSLSVNISVVWLDAQGHVIGFTAPQNVTVVGTFVFFGQPWHTGPSTFDGPLGASVIGPNPGAGPWIHSAVVVFERDHLQELASTLMTAFQSAQNMDFVWSHLPHP